MRIAILGALLVPFAAHAGDAPTSDADMHAAFRDAIEAVQRHSEYRDIPPLRHWVKVPFGDMGRMAIRNGAAGDHRNVIAMYVCSEKAMYLSEMLDPSDPDQMALVVHEMVHHAQCEAGRFTRDLCPAEREAYRVQADYLRSLDVRPQSRAGLMPFTKPDDLKAASEAACRAARNR